MSKPEDEIEKSAKELSQRGASRGGEARARNLSAEEKSDIARTAALARWGDKVVDAPYSGTLVIGDWEIKCAVTAEGKRLINQDTFLRALGRDPRPKGGTGSRSSAVPAVISAKNLQPFVSNKLRKMYEPVSYRPESGGKVQGFDAEILPEVCDVYLDARNAGVLHYTQERVAEAAEILMRGLARVGIAALIDEATGYQETRARRELQKILEAYIVAELRPWTKMFPDEFFKQVYRLQGWEYKPGTAKRTPYVGKLINQYIYEQLPPGVLETLREKNPRTSTGRRAHKHHQFLTTNTGSPHLDRQIATVTTLMRISEDKKQFEELFEKAFPPAQDRIPLVIELTNEGEEEGKEEAA
jgi:hypothetical protein